MMTKEQIAKMIDHTLLKPAKDSEITALCAEAKQYGFASALIPATSNLPQRSLTAATLKYAR